MAIEDIYAMLDALEGVEVGGIRDAIGAEFGTVTEGANARIEELTSKLADTEKALTDMKARNFDLMTAATAPANPGEDEGEENEEEYKVDDLFKKED